MAVNKPGRWYVGANYLSVAAARLLFRIRNLSFPPHRNLVNTKTLPPHLILNTTLTLMNNAYVAAINN